MKSFKGIVVLILMLSIVLSGPVFAEKVTDPASLEPVGDVHTAEDLPWYLTLVNASHAVPEDWNNPGFTELKNGQSVDERIYPQLQAMFDAARADGIRPMGMTSYGT